MQKASAAVVAKLADDKSVADLLKKHGGIPQLDKVIDGKIDAALRDVDPDVKDIHD